MSRNQKKFHEIKDFLIEKLGEKIKYSRDEDETEYLEIKNSNFWISNTFGELVVGYGFNHTHFSEEFNNLNDGIFQVFALLTNRIKTTNYIKGNKIFKTSVEIEYSISNSVIIGTSSIILYPFWKKTQIEINYAERILDLKEIEYKVNTVLETDFTEYSKIKTESNHLRIK
ncbi:hypothetical protein ASG01_10115 [Chryseobacterium sp. Leaf180]|uniref:hypothetical protein n=1 Tax=Chryseobacterium sp. Leaf180 TaxID=1736289 RepID=UPI0006FAD5DE|nr:hypothetical protein [Chryseobacterium sp. Leaf180]KQR93519.1 hypothetical protein ASG01_10115 [Chryseobacterium sp. Leaf180]